MYTSEELLSLHQCFVEKMCAIFVTGLDMPKWGWEMLNRDIYQFIKDKPQGKPPFFYCETIFYDVLLEWSEIIFYPWWYDD